MINFTVNARDANPTLDGVCGSCCCEFVKTVPDEINKWRLNYSPWLAGIGGRGLVLPVQFEFTKLTTTQPPTNAGNLPPSNKDQVNHTLVSTPFVIGDVATNAVDPEGAPMTFGVVPLSGPAVGSVAMTPDGKFTYTPRPGYVGYDKFYFTTSDGINVAIINSVTMVMDPGAPASALPDPVEPGIVSVDLQRVKINTPFIEFPLITSKKAAVGDVYRMVVKATSMDCDGGLYTHLSCFDISITACGK